MRETSAKDLVLMLLAKCPEGTLKGITRLEKLAYLVSRSPSFGNLEKRLRFEPLHYGPYSEVISQAVEVLIANGFVSPEPVRFELQSRNRGDEMAVEERQGVKEYVETRNFQLTTPGRTIADHLFRNLGPSQRAEMERILKEVGGAELPKLIRRVYDEAPEEMLSRSVIRSEM